MVIDGRESEGGSYRRRRVCVCGTRFTTYERCADNLPDSVREMRILLRAMDECLKTFTQQGT